VLNSTRIRAVNRSMYHAQNFIMASFSDLCHLVEFKPRLDRHGA
jgi:hypothetical protein